MENSSGGYTLFLKLLLFCKSDNMSYFIMILKMKSDFRKIMIINVTVKC